MSSLDFKDVTKSYGDAAILHDIGFSIARGEFVVFVGPSGCGKSTLLRMIAGLEDVTSGEIVLDGEVINDIQPADRGVAMVFQSYALYPHMTVAENMGFGLKMSRVPKPEIEQRVGEAAEMLQIGHLLDRFPKQLSGGQRQRVAIGRAITRHPRVFLFDEPLSNLDAALRVATRIEIAKLKQRMPDTTMIYVTHDQVEAMTLADRIVVLNRGHVEQVGTPMELYHTPNNMFVAGFIGSPAMNFLPVKVDLTADGAIGQARGGQPFLLGNRRELTAGRSYTAGIRPEDFHLAGDDFLVEGTVTVLENLGEFLLAYVEIGEANPLIAKIAADSALAVGEKLRLTAPSAKIHLFSEEGVRLI